MRVGADGDLVISSEFDQISESIRTILGTKPGERRMKPEFGSDLHKLNFENFGPATETLARKYTIEAIQRWEPRVNVEEVALEEVHGDDGVEGYNIHISYTHIRFNVTQNLVYPFYLNRDTGA